MGGVIFLGAFVVAALGIGAAILYGTRGEPNGWPARGDSFFGNGMDWWQGRWPGRGPGSAVPDTEEAMGPHYDLRTVERRLKMTIHHRRRPAASWMDDPDAFKRAGLVDEDGPKEAGAADQSRRS